MNQPTIKLFSALAAVALSTVCVHAAGTDSWVGNTSVNWNTALNWTTVGGSTPPANGDSLVFGAAGSSGTSLNNNISSLSVNNLTINSGASAFTMSGNGLTLNGTLTDGASVNETFSSGLILGSFFTSIMNTGSGTLDLGALTRTAGNGGSVNFTATGTIHTTAANNNGILGGWATVGNAGTAGASGDWAAVDGSGNIITNAGYTTISGSTTGSGASAQNWLDTDGTASLTASATVNSLVMRGDFNVQSGATLTLNSGGLIFSGASRWFKNNGAGSIAGTAQITSGLASGELFVDSSGSPTSDADWRIWAKIVDNGGTPVILVKNGPGYLRLMNANTYSGGTILNGGRVLCDNATSALGTGPLIINGNVGIWLNANLTTSGALSGGGTLDNTVGTGGASWNINGDINNFSGTIAHTSDSSHNNVNLGGGTANSINGSNMKAVLNGTSGGARKLSLNGFGVGNFLLGDVSGASGSLLLNNSVNVGYLNLNSTYGGQIINGANTPTVTKVGTGALTLAGASTYPGVTTVEGGALIAGANVPASGNGPFGNAASAIALGDATSESANQNVALLVGGAFNMARPVTVGAGNATTATFTLGGNSANSSIISGAVTMNQNLVVTQAVGGTVNIAGVISASGSQTLTKVGGGTAILSGVNSYTGVTTVSNGVLLVGLPGQSGGTVSVKDGGAAAGVSATNDATYWSPSSLTVGTSTGGSLQFNLGGSIAGSTANTLLTPSSLTLNGTTTINIGSAPFVNGASYPLFSGYTSGTLVLGSQPNGLVGRLVVSGGTVSYAVTNLAVSTWTAAVSTNWDTTTANWTNSIGGNLFAANYPVQLNDSANGAGPLLVNITPSAVTPSTITVSNTAKSYVIGGQAISGSTGLTKAGNNTLTLTGTNTFTGGITVSGGALEVGGQLGSGTYAANIQNDATLKYNSPSDQTLSGVISGNGALVKTNTGTLTLSGANTFIGGVTNNAGTLKVGNNNGLGAGNLTLNAGTLQNAADIAITNNIVSGGGGTISIPAGGNNVFYSGSLSGTGPLTIGGGGPIQSLNLGFAANTLTGTITIPASPNQTVVRFKTTTAGSATAAWDITGDNTTRFVTLDFDGTIDFGSLTGPGILAGNGGNQKTVSVGALGTSTTFSGSIRNGSATAVALTKVGAGVLTLSGGNTYTGLTTVQNGSLVAGAAGAFGADSSPIALGDDTTISGNLSPSLLISGAYSLTHDVAVGYDTTPTTGIYTVGGNTANSATLNGGITLNQNLVVTQAVGGTFTIAGGISGGSVSLTKVGAGTVNLAGGYSHSGPVVVNAGTLGLNAAQSSSSASTLTVNNATLALTLNDGNSSIYSADVAFTGSSALNLNFGAATSPSAAAINASGYTVSSTGTTTINVTGPGLVVGQYPIIYTGGSVPTNHFVLGSLPLGVAGVLTNSGASLDLLITSTGQTLTWYGADSLGNPLTTWNINTSSNWNSGNAKYLQYSGNSYGDYVTFDDSLFTPSGAGITLNTTVVPASATFNNNSTAYSITGSGGIGGAASLVKSGSGSLYLGTSNSYTGGTIVNGGTLSVAKDSALGASNGPVTLNGVTLQYSNTTASVRSLTMTANSTLDVAPSANAQLAGVISGSASLTKTGNGTLSLSGTNTYTGKTVVDGGVLSVTGGQVPSPSAAGPGIIVGSTQNAALSISGGNVAANTSDGEFLPGLAVGNASGIAGSVNVSGTGNLASGREIVLGNAAGAYGAWNQSGGTVVTGTNTGGFLVVGHASASGVFSQSGGSFTIGRNATTIAAGDANSLGVMNLSGGTFTSMATSGSFSTAGGLAVGENGTGVLNVSGGASLNLSGNFNLLLGRNTGASGIVNLLGGTLATTQVSHGSGSSTFNFIGGTLLASATNANFMTGLTAAYVYSGGAVINSSSNVITIAQALLAPTAYGVSSITLSSGGSGYIAPPVVTISGGTGSGATAIAQVSGGAVTAVVVISPGTGYQSSDTLTVNFTGGGGSGASANTPALALNTSGGLTKTGNGTLTLSGANTYTGNTTVNAGTLALTQASATLATNSTVTIANGAFLQLTAGTVTNVVAGLVTNGVAAGNGIYSSANSSGYITGSGYLKVGASSLAPTPEPIHTSYNAITGQLTLTWTQPGWRLESQTNNLTTGLSSSGWVNVSGAASPYVITVNPAKPTVFYRLVNP